MFHKGGVSGAIGATFVLGVVFSLRPGSGISRRLEAVPGARLRSASEQEGLMDETQRNAPDEGSPGLMPLRLWMQPAGLMIELTQADNLVGRHSSADVRLPLPDVSRRHCRFVYVGGRWQVRDLNSLNGVFVNEERVAETDLKDGDQVRLGGFTFAVELPSAAADKGILRRLFPGRPIVTYRSQQRRAS
jgi:hypothetical protein